MIKSQQLAEWAEEDGSSALVVNGNFEVKRKSPLSFVCARLIHALDEIRSPEASQKATRPDIITVHFFCGQHDTLEESWESPSGIINSLLSQLLTQCKGIHPSKVTRGKSFDNANVEKMFGCFKAALDQLPTGATVFCVIDAISFYVDINETRDDAKWLVSSLLRLTTKKPPKKADFKVLLTAPSRLRISESKLHDAELLNISRRLPNTGGFTAMRWNVELSTHLGDALT